MTRSTSNGQIIPARICISQLDARTFMDEGVSATVLDEQHATDSLGLRRADTRAHIMIIEIDDGPQNGTL